MCSFRSLLGICDDLGHLLKKGQLQRWAKLSEYKKLYEEAVSRFDSEKARYQESRLLLQCTNIVSYILRFCTTVYFKNKEKNSIQI